MLVTYRLSCSAHCLISLDVLTPDAACGCSPVGTCCWLELSAEIKQEKKWGELTLARSILLLFAVVQPHSKGMHSLACSPAAPCTTPRCPSPWLRLITSSCLFLMRAMTASARRIPALCAHSHIQLDPAVPRGDATCPPSHWDPLGCCFPPSLDSPAQWLCSAPAAVRRFCVERDLKRHSK